MAALPLPRTGLALWTVVVLLFVAFALIAPFVAIALSSHGVSGALHFVKDGGLPNWGLLLLHPLCAVVIAVLGVFAVRGKGAPPVVLFGIALVPLFVSILGRAYEESQVFAAISGEAVDMGQKLRILAEGFSEANTTTVLGSWSSAFLCATAGLAAAGSVIDLDTRRMAPRPNAWIVGTALGGGLAIVALVVRVLSPSWGGGALAKLGLVFAVLAAALAGPALAKLRGIDDAQDPKQAGRVGAAVVATAALFGLTCFLFDRAAFASVERLVLGAISGETVDASQRARILMEVAPGVAATRVAMIFDTVAAVVAFAPAVVASLRRPAWGATIATVAIALVAVLGMAASAWRRDSKTALVDTWVQANDAALPELPDMPSDELSAIGASAGVITTVIGADGRAKSLDRPSYRAAYVVAPDRRARFSAVFDAAPAVGSTITTSWGAAPEFDGTTRLVGKTAIPAGVMAKLGPYAGFLGGQHLAYEVKLARTAPRDAYALLVIQTAPDQVRLATRSDERLVSLAAPTTARDDVVDFARKATPTRVVVVPLADAVVDDVYRVIRVARAATRYSTASNTRYTYGDGGEVIDVTSDRDGALAALHPPPAPPPAPATTPAKPKPAPKKR